MTTNKYESAKPSNTWCIKFEVDNYEDIENSTIFSGRLVESMLKRVYNNINAKC